MRELKFRAWDPDRKKMFTHPKWVMFTVDKSGNLTAKNYGYDHQERELEIMQFSGLRDVDGVEIYDGDIVRLNGGGISAVEFIDCGFYVKVQSIYSLLRYDWELICNWESIKVIGNIHENQELLEAK